MRYLFLIFFLLGFADLFSENTLTHQMLSKAQCDTRKMIAQKWPNEKHQPFFRMEKIKSRCSGCEPVYAWIVILPEEFNNTIFRTSIGPALKC